MIKIFDGHNDLLLRLWISKDFNGSLFFKGGKSKFPNVQKLYRNLGIGEKGHIDFDRAISGGLVGGLFAIFVPSHNLISPENSTQSTSNLVHHTNNVIDQKYAYKVTTEMLDIVTNMAKSNPLKFKIIKSKHDLKNNCFSEKSVSALLHLEGAEAISSDFRELEEFYNRGLRSIGPVWSRSNIFGTGVPFKFLQSPDQGPGLTALGKELVLACSKMGILLDLSHMNERGFWDVVKISSMPLIASHSNAFTLSKSPRNLTNEQLDAIRDSRGIVGLNFATGFLREDGKSNTSTSVEVLIKHLDFLLNKLGENGVALGSDFDGAAIADFMRDCSGLQKLVDAMDKSGFGARLIHKICRTNWIDVISKIIK